MNKKSFTINIEYRGKREVTEEDIKDYLLDSIKCDRNDVTKVTVEEEE